LTVRKGPPEKALLCEIAGSPNLIEKEFDREGKTNSIHLSISIDKINPINPSGLAGTIELVYQTGPDAWSDQFDLNIAESPNGGMKASIDTAIMFLEYRPIVGINLHIWDGPQIEELVRYNLGGLNNYVSNDQQLSISLDWTNASGHYLPNNPGTTSDNKYSIEFVDNPTRMAGMRLDGAS
jgi:hypothetical protein